LIHGLPKRARKRPRVLTENGALDIWRGSQSGGGCRGRIAHRKLGYVLLIFAAITGDGNRRKIWAAAACTARSQHLTGGKQSKHPSAETVTVNIFPGGRDTTSTEPSDGNTGLEKERNGNGSSETYYLDDTSVDGTCNSVAKVLQFKN